MNSLALLPNLAGPDMLIIFLIVLIMFGAKKLPELAKGLGQAVREFSKAKEDMSSELHRAAQVDTPAHHYPPVEHPLPQAAVSPAPAAPAQAAAPSANPVAADAATVHAAPPAASPSAPAASQQHHA
jgi:sec-independent protein translocase protein TatA